MPKKKGDSLIAKAGLVPTPVCIIHSPSVKSPGPFTPFRNVQSPPTEKLADLLHVRDRRLAEPLDSPYRLEAECRQLPQSLDQVDLETTGYHRQCYARFTKNLNRLRQPSDEACASTSTAPSKHHSPRKRTSDGEVLFPPECIFCEKVEIKTHGTTESPKEFPHWKHKDSGWSKIAPIAELMGNTTSYQKEITNEHNVFFRLVQYQEQSDLAFQLLIKSQLLDKPLDLEMLMSYSLTPVPASLGTPDGFFNKTNKAAAMHFLLEDMAEEEDQYPKDSIWIQDGNTLFHTLTALPPTFGEICLKVLDHMVIHKAFIFSTDNYLPDSIKSSERRRRGTSEKFILDGAATRKPADFKVFLSNDDNKLQLAKLMLKVWSSPEAASRLVKCKEALLIVEGQAYKLKASDEEVSPNKFIHIKIVQYSLNL